MESVQGLITTALKTNRTENGTEALCTPKYHRALEQPHCPPSESSEEAKH
eukprot:NODE_3907_length_511_cov_79.512987_g3332_i0.p3 GENE.NODE_3907_length_511_cov_79.512987_g3332_i0~~NODE_3907_length_511_cov_79.512987_g3332_i0.p3  ORF type:complete len:50 (+),score=3.86 NODE_3907_length_511_cov_79.512987_g3332_i0:98-247(+)